LLLLLPSLNNIFPYETTMIFRSSQYLIIPITGPMDAAKIIGNNQLKITSNKTILFVIKSLCLNGKEIVRYLSRVTMMVASMDWE